MARKLIPFRTCGFDLVFNEDNQFVTHSIQVPNEFRDMMRDEMTSEELARYAFKCLHMLASSMLDTIDDEHHMKFMEAFLDEAGRCNGSQLQRYLDNKTVLRKPKEKVE